MKSRRAGLLVAVVVAMALAVPVVAAMVMADDDALKARAPAPSATIPVYGDGRSPEAHDLRMANLQAPSRLGVPGIVSFEILDPAARPETSMIRAQTRLLHLYVVRDDYGFFRHVHPRLVDGTWSAPITLPSPGNYRFIADVTVDAGDHDDHVYLAGVAVVPGARAPAGIPSNRAPIEASVENADDVIASKILTLRLSSRTDGQVDLGAYDGQSVFVTAFDRLTGTIARLNPMGKPSKDGDDVIVHLDARELSVASLNEFFIQVRLAGRAYTLRVVEQVS